LSASHSPITQASHKLGERSCHRIIFGAAIQRLSMTSGPDIILGVARAADSVKHREAASRLERMSGQVTGAANASAHPDDSASASGWSTDVRHAATATSRSARVISSSSKDGPEQKQDVHVQFEALLLQNMIEAMLPKDTEALMGSGTAGNIWKSMLAEKIAAEIARTGTLGIAKQLASGPAASSAAAPSAQSKVDET
jgi:flagellar protein FlgJ